MTHSGEIPLQCQTCEKFFAQKEALKVHERIHTGEKPFTCTVCAKSFRTSSYIKVHMRFHVKKKQKEQARQNAQLKNDVENSKESTQDIMQQNSIQS